jgi:sulfofructose kinase
MAEIICVGVAFLDYVFEADLPASDDSKTFARSYQQFGGGMAATASVTVAKLGGRASLWGRVGMDEAGERIRDGLARHGVMTDVVRQIEGAQSPVSSVVIGDKGARQAIVFPGRNLDSDASWLPLGRIADASAVLVDPRWPQAAIPVLERARENQVPGVLDADIGPTPVPRELVELASHAIFSLPGLLQYADTPDIPAGLHKAREGTDAVVGVTAGGGGFYWLSEDDNDVHHTPALAIEPVDTLGAGDVFHGAFALAVGEGKSLEEAAQFANTAAGMKCARHGGRDAIPARGEVWATIVEAASV